MTFDPATAERFCYEDHQLDRGRLTCRYSLDGWRFEERITFAASEVPDAAWSAPAVAAAARWVFLLAGVSYYKAAAPPVVDLGALALTDEERRFLRSFYLDGLGEYAYRNGLDLTGVRFEGPTLERREPVPYAPEPAGRPLVPFGGGIDSVVVAESVRDRFPDAALFVVSRVGDRFAAIERPAALTGLPVVRAEREIDRQVLRSRELGLRNGHVPVTGILSAIAVMAAVLEGRDAVVMSNERSASVPNLEVDGRPVNHQHSKSAAFEAGFRAVLAGALGPGLRYFSLLRPYSELWVAERFAALPRYFRAFRSCNRAFHVDPAQRLDRWCGRCDKCCFVDLVLAPFLPAAELGAIFAGSEPLADPSLADRFRTLLATSPETKPFECVGDAAECRAAARLAAARPDRAGAPLLRALVAELGAEADGSPGALAPLLRPSGAHFVPDDYAPEDLLV